MNPLLLIADDERCIRRRLETLFACEGYRTATARNGEEVLEKLPVLRPDLLLLDVMMPRKNGFAVCETVRREDPRLPILFLTALDDEVDRVRGLSYGGDDYIAKTAGDAELLARVRRALARVAAYAGPAAARRTVRIGDLTVDAEAGSVSGGPTTETLTKTELQILLLLASDPTRTFTSDEIIAHLRGEGFACEDSMLYSHVSRLKTKLGDEGVRLVNRRRIGYRLDL